MGLFKRLSKKGQYTLIKREWNDDEDYVYHIDLSKVKKGDVLWKTGGAWYDMDAITIEDVGDDWVTVFGPMMGTHTLHPGESASPGHEWQVAPYCYGSYSVRLIEGEYQKEEK